MQKSRASQFTSSSRESEAGINSSHHLIYRRRARLPKVRPNALERCALRADLGKEISPPTSKTDDSCRRPNADRGPVLPPPCPAISWGRKPRELSRAEEEMNAGEMKADASRNVRRRMKIKVASRVASSSTMNGSCNVFSESCSDMMCPL